MASNGIPSWSTTAANNVQSLTGVNWDEGQAPSTVNDSARQILADLALWFANFGINTVENFTLSLSVGASALTIAVKRRDGSDPTAVNPARVAIRSATAANGDYSLLSLTAATSLTVTSGSTLGTVNSEAFRLWILGFNDGGTFRLGVVKTTTGSDSAGWSVMSLGAWGIASSTAEGGGGGADTAQTIYTGTAVTSKPYQVLGYATWESGLATAGTWSAAPTRVELYRQGLPLPGQVVGWKRSEDGAVNTTTTALPNDDTIPQNTEGGQFLTTSYTPSSAANLLNVSMQMNLAHATTGIQMGMALFRDSTANALAAVQGRHTAGLTLNVPYNINHSVIAGATTSTTFNGRGGGDTGATVTFNGVGGGRLFGGVMNSYIEVREIMA